MTLKQVDAVRVYEINGQVCPLLAAQATHTVGANRTVVTGVSGSKIAVMGWIAQTDGAAAGSMQLKSASAGTMLMAPLFVPPSTGGLNDKLPIVDVPYFQTNSGEGLFVDIVTTAISLTVFYLIYESA